ncbi:MAG TPA: 2-oxoacid:ferredoxin oxidoreductase subunit beta, partial [Flavisolibacter sp.]|nr:2-oxoacid:ferredoxin oxidoreductase subunit beta [Flavisolibacter sp.]
IFLEHGKPLIFGENNNKGIRLDGLTPEIFDLRDDDFHNDIWVHDEKDKTKANLIARFFDTTFRGVHFPRPFGVIYAEERPTYDEALEDQSKKVAYRSGRIPLNKILSGDKTWTIL